MKSIKKNSEYLAAVKDKTSKDPSICNEANRTLENKEHPEINVAELRIKAKERLKRGSHGFALCFDLPPWLTEENLLKSVDQLTISDLITASGTPVPRQTLLRKCIKIAVEEKRIDEVIVRDALKYDNPWSSPANRQSMLVFALAAIDALDDNLIVDITLNYYRPVLNQLPKEIRGYAKKAFCSACRKVINAKGVQCFICTDGTINVDKVLRSIPEKGNEELFKMLSNLQEYNNDRT